MLMYRRSNETLQYAMTVDLPLQAGDRHVFEWATPAMARLTAGKRNMTLERQISNVNLLQ